MRISDWSSDVCSSDLLRLPPLRERKEDIPALVQLFMQNSAADLGVPVRRVASDAMRILCGFDYPGNIRQLENFCQWLTVMSSSQVVEAKDLPPEVLAAAGRSEERRAGKEWVRKGRSRGVAGK